MKRHVRYGVIGGGLVCGVAMATLSFVSAEQRGGGAGGPAGPAGGRGGAAALAEPFKGVTTNGTTEAGLFPIRATGVSTKPVMDAAVRFLAALSPADRARTTFPVTDTEWRDWNNIHRYTRKGVSLADLSPAQREQAFGLMRAGLSAKGFEQSRNIMRLNGYLAELTKSFDEYGEFLYHFTVMGTPSPTEPWGWQLDGHHLIINYFVMGDQVVMTPTFMGSEPISSTEGASAGIRLFEDEQNLGLALATSLTPEQRKVAVLETSKPANNALAQAFRDNLVLDYAGIRADALTPAQRTALLRVVNEYVRNMSDGHAKVRMAEIEAHLNRTYFAWIGPISEDAVFYYRVHSPVLLIEFDHQSPVALPGERVPSRRHVHTVVRTPNGNDYGKDLLRQHIEANANNPAHGHTH
jgi:hypothetical protein